MPQTTEYPRLPRLDDKNITLPHFPSAQAAVIFRLWETVPADRIALVLKTSTENVAAFAARMGLPPQRDLDGWFARGYISIIKSVWHLLPYSQILALLGWDEEQLQYILKEDDFLGEKLGSCKPACAPVIYHEPDAAEWAAVDRIGAIIQEEFPDLGAATQKPFDFFARPFLQRNERPHPFVEAGWHIVDTTGLAGDYIADFVDMFATVWGVQLAAGEGDGPAICLALDTALDGAETHRVTVSTQEIIIEASAAVGLLRGLHYVLQTTDLTAGVHERSARFDIRMIYSFCGLYSNVLDEDIELSFPDELLRRYALMGVNGVWLQGVLYKLLKFSFDPSMSVGWQERLARLQALTKKAARYGIKVYCYLNEPRCMPLSFFDKYPDLKGEVENGQAAMCTSHHAVREYLRDAVTSLCRAVPELGGFFLINMSENLTHCYSHARGVKVTGCPRCTERSAADVLAEVVNTIAEGARIANCGQRVIAWAWGWGEMLEDIVRQLPQDVILMSTAEEATPYTRGGVSGQVLDYTMFVTQPGELSRARWQAAAAHGLETAAKVMINTTWEGSTDPFLPVFHLLHQYMNSLLGAGVRHLMLSWTLGGYPSDNIRVASKTFFCEAGQEDTSLSSALTEIYGDNAAIVERASALFSKAFTEFPFHINTLYQGPQNSGPANLLYGEPSRMTSTMTGFAYDDLKSWRSIYPEDVFLSQFEKVSTLWEEGLELLHDFPAGDFLDAAETGYALYRSCYNQVKFVMRRDAGIIDKSVIIEEKELAKLLHRVMCRNASVGYEAANHYYFTKGMLLEKVLNCRYLSEQ